MQPSLFDAESVNAQPGDSARLRAGQASPLPRLKWLCVSRVPTAATLWDAVTPAAGDIEKLEERTLLRAWKYAAAARHMMLRGLQPRSYHWRRQHHILHQCGDPDRLRKIEAEVSRRGLLEKFGVDISFQESQKCPA